MRLNPWTFSILLSGLASAADAQVEVVADPGPRCAVAPFTIDASPLLEIGGLDGGEATDFGAILAARFADGAIAVSDLNGREIRLFDATNGRFLRSIGRSGRGPAEFAAAPSIARSSDGGLWAWDPGNRRLSLFSLSGNLQREEHFAGSAWGFPSVFTLNAWHVSPSGVVLSMGGTTRLSRNLIWDIQAIHVIEKRAGRLVTIGPRDSASHVLEDGLYVEDPFRAPRTAAIVGDAIWLTRVGAWGIEIYNAGGQRTKILRHGIPRIPISAGMKARERHRVEQSTTPGFLRLFDRLAIGDSTSAIGGLKVSSDGTVWVQRWHSRRMDDDQVFDVLEANGRWLGTVRLPPGAGRLADVAEDQMLTIRRDEFDVPYVRRYRMTRSCP